MEATNMECPYCGRDMDWDQTWLVCDNCEIRFISPGFYDQAVAEKKNDI
jgi:hypothetical protein